MNKYYGFTYGAELEGGIETIGLLPLDTSCPFQFGYYDFKTDELVLQSKDAMTNLKLVPKIDEYGMTIEKGGRKQMERRLLTDNLTFRLKGEDMEWFLYQMVENTEVCIEVIKRVKHGKESTTNKSE